MEYSFEHQGGDTHKRRVPSFCQAAGYALALAVSVAALAILTACRREMPPAQVQPNDITLPSGMQAGLESPWTSDAQRAAGVVLVHDIGDSRAVWQALTNRMTREGFAVLAVDLPGHGASPGDWRHMDGGDWKNVAQQLEQAREALVEAGADATRIAYVGAGLGANLAVTAAHTSRGVAALVLVSPGWEIQGLDVRGVVGTIDQRPVLLIAAEGDSYATGTATGMKAEAPGFCELRLYPGTAHGVDLLDSSEHAREQLVEWLKLVLADG